MSYVAMVRERKSSASRNSTTVRVKEDIALTKDFNTVRRTMYDPEFQEALQSLVLECGDYLRHVKLQADLARGTTKFTQVDIEDLNRGDQREVFNFKWKGTIHNFWVKKKADGSPLTSADIYIHNRLKDFFQKHLPGVPFISEENPPEFNQAQADAAYKLRKRGIVLPSIIVDSLDNTRGFYSLIMGDKHPSSRQCSINVSVSWPTWNRGISFVDLPFQNQHFHTDGRQSYRTNNTHLPNHKSVALEVPEGRANIEKLVGATGYHGHGKMHDFLNKRHGKEFSLVPSVGANRAFLLYDDYSGVNVARTGGGCFIWDFLPLWEILCQHFSVGLKEKNLEGDKKGRPLLNFNRPNDPICSHFIAQRAIIEHLDLVPVEKRIYESLSRNSAHINR